MPGEHRRATPAPPWAGTRCGLRCCQAGSQPPRGAVPSSTLPPALRHAHARLSPATGAEALWVFIGISGIQLCRFDSSCASRCAAGMEGGSQPLGALSSLSPAPSPPHSSCPRSSLLLHHPDLLPGRTEWPGHVAAQGGRAHAVGTPHLWHPVQTWGCSPMGLGLQSPFPNEGPSSIGPRLRDSPAAQQGDATPWDGQPSPQLPGARHGSYLEHGASRAQGWAAPSPLPSGLLHPPHTVLRHPLRTRGASSFGDWFARTD